MNNLLPFTIEAYERGEEVVYRNGEKPDEIHWFKTNKTPFPIITVYNGTYNQHTLTGGSSHFHTEINWDLFIKPKTVEKYRNEYENAAGQWFDSIAECDERQGFGIRRNCYSKGTFSGDKLISIEIVTPQSTDNGKKHS